MCALECVGPRVWVLRLRVQVERHTPPQQLSSVWRTPLQQFSLQQWLGTLQQQLALPAACWTSQQVPCANCSSHCCCIFVGLEGCQGAQLHCRHLLVHVQHRDRPTFLYTTFMHAYNAWHFGNCALTRIPSGLIPWLDIIRNLICTPLPRLCPDGLYDCAAACLALLLPFALSQGVTAFGRAA